MLYHDFKGLKLSALGLGCMRFPKTGEAPSDVNVPLVEEMFDYAIKNGINYFDTAYPYHGGTSEALVGNILSKYPRDSFYLATKFPGFKPEMMAQVTEIFQEQLDRCAVDYFDFYLLHNVCESSIDDYCNDTYGVMKHILQQKREGKIRHLGFSTHGSLRTMERFLMTYGKELEFCQIQLNYLDWELQNAKAKVDLIRSFGLDVWVMEPVRGGKLAKLDDSHESELKQLRPDESIPAWAFRFLQTLPNVGVVLSGMSDMQQLQENISIFSESKPLDSQEISCLMNIAADMIRQDQVPCTQCGYCLEHCVQNLPIPELIQKYNNKEEAQFVECIACRNCESACPQGIAISEIMQKLV